MRCPASKFITHTYSHLCFLILLAAATLRLDEQTHPISVNVTSEVLASTNESYAERVEGLLKANFRPANVLNTHVQMCLSFWMLGRRL